MLQVSGYGVRNLRSLRDTGVIELKPLTILVGKNSAGKSSFARILPLLKQSAERRKQSPLLWFGRLVDFGSFNDVLSTFAEKPEIELTLRFVASRELYLGRRAQGAELSSHETTSHIDVRMTLASEGDDARTVLRSLVLNVFGVEVKITNSSPRDVQVTVDGKPAVVQPDARVALFQGTILPHLRLVLREQTTSGISDAALFLPQRRVTLGTREVRSAISFFVHGNTLDERKDEICSGHLAP